MMADFPQTIVAIDVETDGGIPGLNSMLQLGAVAFDMEGKELSFFSMNLHPLRDAVQDSETMAWWRTQPTETITAVWRNPQPPRDVMLKYDEWLQQFRQALMFAAPVAFDGLFVRWYLVRFLGESIRWRRMLDMRSVIWAQTGIFSGDYKAVLKELTGKAIKNPQPHIAVNDAREQGQILFAFRELCKNGNVHH